MSSRPALGEGQKEGEGAATALEPSIAGTAEDVKGNETLRTHYHNVSRNPSHPPPPPNRLSKVQLESVDRAFERIFGYPWGTRFVLPPALSRKQRALVRIFGPETTAWILASNPRRKRLSTSPSMAASPSSKASSSVISNRTLETSAAGKSPSAPAPPQSATAAKPPSKIMSSALSMAPMNSSKTDVPLPPTPDQRPSAVMAASAAATATASPALPRSAAGGGMARLLSEISGKPAVTTIAKTSADWDAFKDKSGLGTAIEEKAQSKDSYLNRQDFLDRVDHRRFEVERQERDRERTKRGT